MPPGIILVADQGLAAPQPQKHASAVGRTLELGQPDSICGAPGHAIDEVWLVVREQCVPHWLFGRASAPSPRGLALRCMTEDVGGSGIQGVRGGVSLDRLERKARLAFDRARRDLLMPLLQRLDPY